MTDALPDNTGYVAAAYLVFLALVLIYVVIMASKLARFERELSELNALADRRADDEEREREAVGTQFARSSGPANLESEPSQ